MEPTRIKRRITRIENPVTPPVFESPETASLPKAEPFEIAIPEVAVETEFGTKVVPLTGETIPMLPKSFKAAGNITREEVEARFHLAFELIGGVERFALWAAKNPTEFYRMYQKLLPAPDTANASNPTIHINLDGGMSIPISPLDQVELRDESAVNAKWTDKDGV